MSLRAERYGRHFGLRELFFLCLRDAQEQSRAGFFVDPAGLGFVAGLAIALTLFLLGLLGLTLQTLCAEASRASNQPGFPPCQSAPRLCWLGSLSGGLSLPAKAGQCGT